MNIDADMYRIEADACARDYEILETAARKAIELLTIPNRRPDIEGAIAVLWDGMGEQPSATPDTPPDAPTEGGDVT